MITAEQARLLSGPSAEEYLELISKRIEAAANEKKREVIIRDNPYADWLYNEKTMIPVARKVVDGLRKNGFEVKLYYNELQFVDMGLWIKW